MLGNCSLIKVITAKASASSSKNLVSRRSFLVDQAAKKDGKKDCADEITQIH